MDREMAGTGFDAAREAGTDGCLHVHCGLTVGADYRALVCQTVGVP